MPRILSSIDAIGVQTREYYRRFLKIGASKSRVAVTGNIKSSLLSRPLDPETREAHRLLLGIPAGHAVWVAASTHAGEEEIIVRVFKRLRAEGHALSLILVPRYPKRTPDIEAVLIAQEVSFRRRTRVPIEGEDVSVIVLDTFGELTDFFALASMAFVGGTLIPHGGHNLLEPLPYCVPVCFGPYFDTQKESARILFANQCGEMVQDEEALFVFLSDLLSHPSRREDMVARIRTLLSKTDIKIKANLDLI